MNVTLFYGLNEELCTTYFKPMADSNDV